MPRYEIHHVDQDGERHHIPGPWSGTSEADAIASMLAQAYYGSLKGDVEWVSHEYVADEIPAPPSYIVWHDGRDWRVVRRDTRDDFPVKIGKWATRKGATLAARMLAGRQGRVSFTHDLSVYPWED